MSTYVAKPCSVFMFAMLFLYVMYARAEETKPIPVVNLFSDETKPSPTQPFVTFFKSLYKSLGDTDGDVREVAKQYKDQYVWMNVALDWQLGTLLKLVSEIRMYDLQVSLEHAKKLRDLVHVLEAEDARDAQDQRDKNR